MGPFSFAWVEPETAFDPVAHAREDEKVVSFSIEHVEGELPTLTIDIKNPRIGLLAPGRSVWAWLSWFNGSSMVPLFYGRLVGIPTNILGEVCTLLFTAKPIDFFDQKSALAETLKVRPHYDPVFIDVDSRDDPDTVLEGYSALWHVDRTSLVVTASDILSGEDGVEIFSADDVPYDSVSISLNQAPLLVIDVDATVAWNQVATGSVDIGNKTIETNSDSILSGWPKAGANLGAGWSVQSSFAIDVFGTGSAEMVTGQSSYQNKNPTPQHGDTMSASLSWNYPLARYSQRYLLSHSGVQGYMDPFRTPPVNHNASLEESYLYVAAFTISTGLTVSYAASRARTERVMFSLKSDLQDVVTLPRITETPDHETIMINGAGDLPIGDFSRRSYFPTDRGLWSLEYLIALARAHLVQRSRVVEVSFDCRFERAINLSCRKNAQLSDHRLPGGQAVGKIIGYTIKGDGDAGALLGTVTIGCAIGYGNNIVPSIGEPTIFESDYVDPGYQFYAGAVDVFATGDVGYTIPIDQPNDDGLVFPLDRAQVVVRDEVIGSLASQQVSTAYVNGKMTVDFGESPIWYELELKPVNNGPFDVEYAIEVSDLAIPKMIDLEGAAA